MFESLHEGKPASAGVTQQGDIRQAGGTADSPNDVGRCAITGVFGWRHSCLEHRMAPEVVIGRWLAFCAHPIAAWRLLPKSGRCLIALSYAAVSYAAALGILLTLD